mgnify:CR=1 FL=1
MSELILKVKTIPDSGFTFNPTSLYLKVIETDILSGYATVYYELSEKEYDINKYLTREWVDRGNIKIPISLISNVSNNGQLDVNLLNQIIGTFNLVYDGT